MWCPACHKTLTTGFYGFGFPNDAVIEWVHGVGDLPPMCPFCKMPPTIENPEAEEPLVYCRICFPERKFKLKEWNCCRPIAWTFERLLERWAKKPEFRLAARALKRALVRHKRGRWFG